MEISRGHGGNKPGTQSVPLAGRLDGYRWRVSAATFRMGVVVFDRMKSTWATAAAFIAVAALLSSGAASPRKLGAQIPQFAAPRPPVQPGLYVALGDSYTGGPFIPVPRYDPAGCLRSDHNYPHLVAAALGFRLRDVSCSGATTQDITSPQAVTPGPNPPQFDALTIHTKLVTMGIGGNDIGFSDILKHCFSPTPFGAPCQDHYVVNGRDEISERLAAAAPKVAAVIQGIHRRSPAARVYVVDYLDILPLTGDGCWPQMPIASADMPYLRAKEIELNTMLAHVAGANRAGLVDAYTASIGHDACQFPTVRWVEPAVPTSPAAPVHPNVAGMEGTAYAVLREILVRR